MSPSLGEPGQAMSDLKLIVVDDEPEMAALIGEVASGEGFSVRLARSGEQFQELWGQEKPSAAVMDIVMPDMDGSELLDWLVRQDCGVPVMLISGYGGRYLEIVRRLGSDRGARICRDLTKPVRVAVLRDALRDLKAEVATLA